MREQNSCTHTHTYKKNLLRKIKRSRPCKAFILFSGARKLKNHPSRPCENETHAHTRTLTRKNLLYKIKLSRPWKAAILFRGAQKLKTIQAGHARKKFMHTRTLTRKICCAKLNRRPCKAFIEKPSKQAMRERNSCTHTHSQSQTKSAAQN